MPKPMMPRNAHWVAWTCALQPQPFDVEIDACVKLAEKAVRHDPGELQYGQVLGAILCRAGRFEDAVRQLKSVAKKLDEEISTSPAYAWYFLAMAHHRLGQSEEAKRWFDKAVARTESELAQESVAWNRRLTLELLRAEAAGLLGVLAEKPPR